LATRLLPAQSKAEHKTAITVPHFRRPAWFDATAEEDPARAVVMETLFALVEKGEAVWTVLESGNVRLDCISGVVLHLGEHGLTRLV
jgi:hypothetical protein